MDPTAHPHGGASLAHHGFFATNANASGGFFENFLAEELVLVPVGYEVR